MYIYRVYIYLYYNHKPNSDELSQINYPSAFFAFEVLFLTVRPIFLSRNPNF